MRGSELELEIGDASNPFPDLFHEKKEKIDDESGSPVDDLDIIAIGCAPLQDTHPHGDS